jgi:hypothetical protein
MQLATSIYNYYLDNQDRMSEDKLFHFATRTGAWIGAPESFEILVLSRGYIVNPTLPLNKVIANVFNTQQTGRRNAHEVRQPFFDKYPALYGAHLALFRIRHLEYVYGIDARDSLYESISRESLLALKDALLADRAAMKALSTFAINFCYLLELVVLKNTNNLPLDYFLELGTSYDTSDKEQIQLLIYFYTHCIIGESNFYVRPIDSAKLPIYHQMLGILEPLIDNNFNDINLDNKLEFLVCARICGFTTTIAVRIYEECENSISPDGTFIIDVHNKNIQTDRNDFVKSEHRNVLFIMSTSPYIPHSTLVK